MIEGLKNIRRKILRLFKMRPIHKVIRLLQVNNYLLMEYVLEVFGHNGEYHTLDYVEHVGQLEIWEINKDCENDLRNNLPKATIKITDSFAQIKSTNKIYDTILIDNHQGLFGDNKCEHFEIIHYCFKKLADKAVLITNVIPDLLLSKYNIIEEKLNEHIERRKQFYDHATGTSISRSCFEKTYKKIAWNNGYLIKHIFFIKRNYLMTYVVLCLEKIK
ncbi:MAG: hypothetical protein HYX39_09540 [Bacteroidetes bacterium]|nr:hypothetical protein [Bacteroidota bacterium]